MDLRISWKPIGVYYGIAHWVQRAIVTDPVYCVVVVIVATARH